MSKPGQLSIFLLPLLLLGCGGGGGGGISGGQITDSAPIVESDSSNNSNNGSTSDQPNILLIIADDQGLDASLHNMPLARIFPLLQRLISWRLRVLSLIMPGQHRPVPQHAVR